MQKHAISLFVIAILFGTAAYASEQGFNAKVIRIVDGDTVDVLREIGEQKKSERIRLASIDAPESSQDYGNRSRQSLAGLCFGRMATVKPVKRDRYARLVASIECDGLDAEAIMVATGMAWVYAQYSSDRILISLEQQARADRRGLWSMPSPVPPWEYRRGR